MKGKFIHELSFIFFFYFYRNLALIRRLDEQPLVWMLFEIISTGYFHRVIQYINLIDFFSR